MLKTVKIEMKEYREIKALAQVRGMLLQRVLTDAVRKYLELAKSIDASQP